MSDFLLPPVVPEDFLGPALGNGLAVEGQNILVKGSAWAEEEAA